MITPEQIAAARAQVSEYNESFRTGGELPFPMDAYNLLEQADKEKYEGVKNAEQ